VAFNRLAVGTIQVVVVMCAHFEFIQCVRFQRGDFHTLTCAADKINGIRLCTYLPFRVFCHFVRTILCVLAFCMFRSERSVSLCCSVYCLSVNVCCTTATKRSGHFSTTITEVFLCFFHSCKANSRV
jgi:hypothetical protein